MMAASQPAADPVLVTVGIADMRVSNRPGDTLITYALGSCLGIAVHDPAAGVGGLLHVMLPSAARHGAAARESPLKFVDTGVPQLFKACYQLGAQKHRLVVKVAGGASRSEPEADRFQIGRNNFVMLRKLFWKNGVLIHSQDVGGQDSRTLALEVGTGLVRLKVGGAEREL